MAIAAALSAGNLKLRRLGLSNNALGNKSAAAFGELLESSHTLKELDLSWNQIKVGSCWDGVNCSTIRSECVCFQQCCVHIASHYIT